MQNAIDILMDNIRRVKELGGLYNAITTLTTSVVDATDLLRAQIVMCVSALDFYIHSVTLIGVLDIYDGRRNPTDAYLKFQVSMSTHQGQAAVPDIRNLLENEIREKHSYLSFQYPDRIADALRLFYPNKIWLEIASLMSMDVTDAKNQLKLIIERRNKIVHEADMDPSYPGIRWPISISDVNTTVDFIEKLCKTIHTLIA